MKAVMSGSRARQEVQLGTVTDTTADGRGVIAGQGKTIFVHGAITGELVSFRMRRRKRRYDEAELVEVRSASPDRVEPRCAAYGVCGGCSLQHVSPARQIELKQAVLLENLQRIGGVSAERVLDPLTGPVWGYRRKARLAVKDVQKKGRVLVGFRERNKPYVADMQRCEILDSRVGERLAGLSELVGSLALRNRIPQIEVAIGDDEICLVFRMLDMPSSQDLERLQAFQTTSGFQIWLQTGGSDTVRPLSDAAPAPLVYGLPEFGLRLGFGPTDFVQVNGPLNARMVSQAVELLEPDSGSKVLDLYCGLGNFSLPVATRAGSVLGIEGSAGMVARAASNAAMNGLDNVQFRVSDLSVPGALDVLLAHGFDRVLLDPPRSGAAEVLDAVARMNARRIVYVSCHPGTLARDAGRLVTDYGYRLAAAGVMDMFPHTSHVESMALFCRDPEA